VNRQKIKGLEGGVGEVFKGTSTNKQETDEMVKHFQYT
jgi:hypothetical protein